MLKETSMFLVLAMFLSQLVVAVSIDICKSDSSPWECESNKICRCEISGTCTNGLLQVYKDNPQTSTLCWVTISNSRAEIDWSKCGNPTGKVKVRADCDEGLSPEKTITIKSTSTPFDFSLSLNPQQVSVVRGRSVQVTVKVDLKSGTTTEVQLSCSNLPAGVRCDFNPEKGNPTFTSTLTISTSSTSTEGTYSIKIYGNGGGKTHSETLTLKIKSLADCNSICKSQGYQSGTCRSQCQSNEVNIGTRGCGSGKICCCKRQSSTTSTTTSPTSSTSTSTTSTTTTSTTTIPQGQSLVIECDECHAGSHCECRVNCAEGLWVLKNEENKPLDRPIVMKITSSSPISFEAKMEGKISVFAFCFTSPYGAMRNHTTLEVKKKPLVCDEECEVRKECKCEVNYCNDGRFIVIQQGRILKDKEIRRSGEEFEFIPERKGIAEVRVYCFNPTMKLNTTIPIVGEEGEEEEGEETTTTIEKEFSVSNFECKKVEKQYVCSVKYHNKISDERVLLVLIFSNPEKGKLYKRSRYVTEGVGEKTIYFTCRTRGTFYVSWKAYRETDKEVPIAWSTSDELLRVRC